MKKTILLILLVLLCFTQSTFAVEYQIPDNFNALMDETYKCIYQYFDVDDTLSYDLFLFDEYSLALSALSRGQTGDMTYEEIKAYFHKSLEQYKLDENFLVMVMVYDNGSNVDLSKLAHEVALQNSQAELLYGSEYERFNEAIFILSFPKEQVKSLLANETTIAIRLPGKADSYHQIFFEKNYQARIPAKITELVELLLQPLEVQIENSTANDTSSSATDTP